MSNCCMIAGSTLQYLHPYPIQQPFVYNCNKSVSILTMYLPQLYQGIIVILLLIKSQKVLLSLAPLRILVVTFLIFPPKLHFQIFKALNFQALSGVQLKSGPPIESCRNILPTFESKFAVSTIPYWIPTRTYSR